MCILKFFYLDWCRNKTSDKPWRKVCHTQKFFAQALNLGSRLRVMKEKCPWLPLKIAQLPWSLYSMTIISCKCNILINDPPIRVKLRVNNPQALDCWRFCFYESKLSTKRLAAIRTSSYHRKGLSNNNKS